MSGDSAARRLLSALAGSTPAFTPATRQGGGFLAALAGSTPAFGRTPPAARGLVEFARRPPAVRPGVRLPVPELTELASVARRFPALAGFGEVALALDRLVAASTGELRAAVEVERSRLATARVRSRLSTRRQVRRLAGAAELAARACADAQR
ncbi:hypothetical protein [Actinokineospora sp. NBRC 105648]|uniref:hypothetical protein n=1 Tax=Actinokineospora sp. NBRC 105648 TaxID=3032206 RepID=UPI00255582FE|nr:hypothetical protein [Actinokineospora sp. NBRC 105648]